MKRDRHQPTMAEIAAAASLEESASAGRRESRRVRLRRPSVHDPFIIELGGRVHTAVEDDSLTPAQAQAMATSTRLVVWDSCGCGGGCGYETWSASRVTDLVGAGPPVVADGELLQLRGEDGTSSGVLVVQDVRWGRLR